MASKRSNKNKIIKIGKRVSKRRKELKIKQNELAERLDISNTHMSSIENQHENPSLDIFVMLCNELSVTPDYLLLGNMHTNDIQKNIIDSLRLCNQKELMLIEHIIKYFIDSKL